MGLILLIGLVLSIVSCGGGGGSSESASPPLISVSGPSEVWSDDTSWTAKLNASNMDLESVAFTITGGDESIGIDTVSGMINDPSSDSGVEPGLNRFTITAVDATGATASTVWDLKSNASMIGIWLYLDPDIPQRREVMYISRGGTVHHTIMTDEGFQGSCQASLNVSGTNFTADSDCMFVEENLNLI